MQKDIILVPFNMDAIYALHVLENERDVVVSGFFDNNEVLAHKRYAGKSIYPPFYRNDTEIIICAHQLSTREALKAQMADIGYQPEQIVILDSETLAQKKSSVLEQVRLADIARLKPLMAFVASHEVRKKRMLKFLQAPDENHFFHKFDNIQGVKIPKSFLGAEKKQHIILRVLTLYVTDKCSLRCKYCAAGKQYYEPREMKDVPLETMMKDYRRMLELVDWIDTLELLGGEPLLRRDLDKIINGICQNPMLSTKVGQLLIVTNATIVPREAVLRAMAQYENVIVQISNYCSASNQINRLVEALERWGIRYVVADFQGPGRGWTKIMQIEQDRSELSTQALRSKREHGCITQCNSVKEGRFYLCDLLVTMHDIHAVPNEQGMSVDIYDADAKEKMARYLSYDEPLPAACSWCSGCSPEDWNAKTIPAAEQIDHPVVLRRF